MNPILEQVTYAQNLGQRILSLSPLDDPAVIYAFATSDTLVINCRDDKTTGLFDEEQLKLYFAIAKLKSSIQNIAIEKAGKRLYYW
jgi:hypothetical protein